MCIDQDQHWDVTKGVLNSKANTETLKQTKIQQLTQCDTTFDIKINIGHSDFILWSSDFSLYLDYCLMGEYYNMG